MPDLLAGRIIREQITPAFKAGDFAGGLNQAVDRIGQAIAGEGLAAPAPRTQGTPRRGSRGFDLQDLAIFLFVGVPILGGILTRLFGRKGGAVIAGGAVGGIGWLLTTSLLVAGGAGLLALLLIGVMGVGSGSGAGRRAGHRRRRRRRWRRLRLGWGWRRRRRLQFGRRRRFRRRRRLGELVMASFLARLFKHRLLDERDARRASAPTAGAHRRVAWRRAKRGTAARSASASRPACRSATCAAHASARERAVAMFGKLRVWDTEHNNGVLVYVLLAEHAIEIVADRGIDRRVDAAAWDAIAAQMKAPFRGGDFAAGLDRAIDAVDALLVRHFPRRAGDGHEAYPNELPDAPDLR